MKSQQLLNPDGCFLHLIDVQESLMRRIHGVGNLTATIALLLKCAPVLGLPVIANTQYKRGLGLYVPELEELVVGIPRPDKVEFNAYANNETISLVAAHKEQRKNVILVGVETHICIYQSAMGALALGLHPWIVTDGVSSRRLTDHDAGLARLVAAGASVGPAEMVIYELLTMAGTKQFKEILPFIVEREGHITAE